jgi:hypothetical protein
MPTGNPYYAASADLGLGDGDALRQQVTDADEERKKKLLQMGGALPGGKGTGLGGVLGGSASMMLLGPGIGGALRG